MAARRRAQRSTGAISEAAGKPPLRLRSGQAIRLRSRQVIRLGSRQTAATRSETVIAHVVLFRPKPDLSAGDRDALLAAFTRAIREIPTVRGVRSGRRVVHGAGYEQPAEFAEVLIVIDFDDLAGLQAYLRHPAHEELGARFGTSLSWAGVADFEVGGIEALRAGGLLQVE